MIRTAEDNVILVIDDDEMNLQIARMVLERKLPCKVITADNGLLGIEILRSEKVRVVLLDVMMPHFDGIETLQEIRADEKLKKIPVIMLTASIDKENIKKAMALGVTDYIRKPFMPKELVERVNRKLVETEDAAGKVLLVDYDDGDLRSMLKILEKHSSYDFVTASSARAAIKILKETEISLVIAGADMRFVSGLKILKFMADDERFSGIPFALTTPVEILKLVDKIKRAKSDKLDELDGLNDSIVITSDKKKIAGVVTSAIGYELV